MSNSISTAALSPTLKPKSDAPSYSGGFGQMRTRRKMNGPKISTMSPEARRAIEEANRRLIDDAVARGRIEYCPAKWADGSIDVQGIAAKD